MPRRRDETDIPDTIERSDRHAQHIWKKAHDSAVGTYGEGRRAHQTAFAALKHEYRKQGDHWVKKERSGPSDPQARRTSTSKPSSTDRDRAKTAGGRVASSEASKQDLYEQAKELGVEGRSKMSKDELAKAVRKAS